MGVISSGCDNIESRAIMRPAAENSDLISLRREGSDRIGAVDRRRNGSRQEQEPDCYTRRRVIRNLIRGCGWASLEDDFWRVNGAYSRRRKKMDALEPTGAWRFMKTSKNCSEKVRAMKSSSDP